MTYYDHLTLEQLYAVQKHLAAIDKSFDDVDDVWALSTPLRRAASMIGPDLCDVERLIAKAEILKRNAKKT